MILVPVFLGLIGLAFGSLNMGEVHEVELFIREPMASFVEERRLHSSQRTVRKEDGITLVMQVRLNDELTRWILSLGGSVQVIRPDLLQESCVAAAQNFISANKPKKSA